MFFFPTRSSILYILLYHFDVKLGMVLDSLKVRLGWQNLAFASFAQDISFSLLGGGNAFPLQKGKVLFWFFVNPVLSIREGCFFVSYLVWLVFSPLDGM